MDETTTVQGREITQADIELVRRLIEADPSRNRSRISQELCLLWNWRTASGRIKDMACRTLLLKLEQRGYIILRPGAVDPVGVLARSLLPTCHITLLLLPAL